MFERADQDQAILLVFGLDLGKVGADGDFDPAVGPKTWATVA